MLLFYGMGFRTTTADVMQIGIIYVSIWIGHEHKLTPNTIIGLIFLYGIMSIYLGYLSVTTYLTTFSMDENMYMIDAKNQIGAIIALAAFYTIYIAQISLRKKVYIVAYAIFAILLILMIYIRCRTALLALLITSFLLIYKRNSSIKLTIYAMFGLLIAAVFADQIIDILQNAFLGDRSTANLDELSSNRLERNDQAIMYIGEHILIGEMKYHSGIEIIHNYILNRIVRYGIWALPLIFIYFIIGFRCFKQVMTYRHFTISDIGYFAMLIPFLCSLLEPDAPFGPGTVYSFTFIMFGYSLKNSLNKDSQ